MLFWALLIKVVNMMVNLIQMIMNGEVMVKVFQQNILIQSCPVYEDEGDLIGDRQFLLHSSYFNEF